MYFLEKTSCKAMDFHAGKWWVKGEEYGLNDKNLKAGYSVPSFEAGNAEKSFRLMGIKYEKVRLASDILSHFNFLP